MFHTHITPLDNNIKGNYAQLLILLNLPLIYLLCACFEIILAFSKSDLNSKDIYLAQYTVDRFGHNYILCASKNKRGCVIIFFSLKMQLFHAKTRVINDNACFLYILYICLFRPRRCFTYECIPAFSIYFYSSLAVSSGVVFSSSI